MQEVGHLLDSILTADSDSVLHIGIHILEYVCTTVSTVLIKNDGSFEGSGMEEL